MSFLKSAQHLANSVALHIKATVHQLLPLVAYEVPCISQFATPEWAERVLRHNVDKTTDPNWHTSGAVSKEEYATWVTTICGMACTVMALKFFTQQNYQTIPLAKEALLAGVYKQQHNSISHMHYHEYVTWLAQYGIKATVYSRLNCNGIRHILTHNGLIIASVNPNIRGFKTAQSNTHGGHLVLVIGYNIKEDTITFHNPSGFMSDKSACNHTLSTQEFNHFFAGRGIGLKRLQS